MPQDKTDAKPASAIRTGKQKAAGELVAALAIRYTRPETGNDSTLINEA